MQWIGKCKGGKMKKYRKGLKTGKEVDGGNKKLVIYRIYHLFDYIKDNRSTQLFSILFHSKRFCQPFCEKKIAGSFDKKKIGAAYLFIQSLESSDGQDRSGYEISNENGKRLPPKLKELRPSSNNTKEFVL